MKKIYMPPTVNTVKINTRQLLCGSTFGMYGPIDPAGGSGIPGYGLDW